MPKNKPPPLPAPLSHHQYAKALLKLQVELVKLQRHVIERDLQVLVIFEGRDAAGKDGTIKHVIEHLSPRETRVVALGPPSDRDQHSWYFQRYVRHLPAGGEIVLFNRSWYNRAGVEPVMGFCTGSQTRAFLETVPGFEEMLARSGIRLFKYYLDISKAEQKRRLKDRQRDPLKQWKLSPIDVKAPKLWHQYSKARNEMLAKTHSAETPWIIVRADDKHHARLNVIRDLLWRLEYPERPKRLDLPDPRIVFAYDRTELENGLIAP
ncbi:MAG TPA: polyphosphate kinase 2 [Stellaceae bacterium]|nr:polyphosphate kinase 2 [Stellaceae bacterium]